MPTEDSKLYNLVINGELSLSRGQLSMKYFQIISPFTGIQECGLVVHEVVENPKVSASKLSGDQKH